MGAAEGCFAKMQWTHMLLQDMRVPLGAGLTQQSVLWPAGSPEAVVHADFGAVAAPRAGLLLQPDLHHGAVYTPSQFLRVHGTSEQITTAGDHCGHATNPFSDLCSLLAAPCLR